MVVELELDGAGAVGRRHFYPAVIRSRARLVYDDVAPALEDDVDLGLGPAMRDQLRMLGRVARSLTKRRFASGSIDFDLPDAEIVLGDEGHPVDIRESPRTLAHRAVEEAMVYAEGRTKTELVNEALRRFARGKRRKGLLELRGKVSWEGDVDQLRKRR